MFELFETVEEKDKASAVKAIIAHASPRREFFLLITLAIAMASFGVLLDSTVILIGSMLIAPILYPVLSLALGITLADYKLVSRSLSTLFKSTVLAFGASLLIGLFFSSRAGEGLAVLSIIEGAEPSLIYAIIAGISGFAAAYAIVRPTLSEMLPGVAIAVSLVPPLAMAGVSMAVLNIPAALNAILLFLINVVGIVLCAMFVFSMLKLSHQQDVVDAAVKKDEEEVKEEQVPHTH